MDLDEQVLDVAAVLAEHGSDDGEMQIESATVDPGNLAVFSYELPEGETQIEIATRLAQELINQIFQLPVERSDVGPLALLPRPKTPIPREKPVPTAKEETKWEKFAREKGIKKTKKERKVWDEVTGTWKYSWGKDGINKEDDWLIEHKEGSLGKFEDPFIQRKAMKKERLDSQEKRRLANKRNAALQSAEASAGGRNSASLVVGSTAPTAGPVSEERLKRAIQMAQRSTRSLGIHDTKREDEPRNKMARKHLPSDSAAEQAQTTKVLKKVVRQAESTEYDRDKMTHQQMQDERVVAKKKRVAKEEAIDAEKRKRKMR